MVCIYNILMAVVLCLVLVQWPLSTQAQGGLSDTCRVVVLHSFHKGQPWNDDLSTGIENHLNINNIELNFEYMDTGRLPNKTHGRHLEELLRQKYHQRKVDIVISTDEEALDFMLVNRSVLFPGATIVYCGIKAYIDRFWVKKLTGIIESVDLTSNIELARKLNPRLKNIYVVMDNTSTSISLINNFIRAIETFSTEISFRFSDFVSFETLLATIRDLSDDTAVFLVNYTNDQSGRVISMKESARSIAHNSPVPVYSIWDSYLGHGILGGKLVSGYSQGRMAAEIALRIIRGDSVENIPVQTSILSQYKFDFVQLEKYGIKEADLPPGSFIVNKPDTLYRQYKRLIFMLIFGSISFSLIIFLLIINIMSRRREQKSLKGYSSRLDFLYRIDQSILSSFSLQSICSNILNPTLKMTDCDLIGIYLFERDLMPACGFALKKTAREKPITDIDIPLAHLPDRLTKRNQIVKLGKEEAVTRHKLFSHEVVSGYDWFLLIPLMFKNHPLGVFYLGNAFGRSIDPDQETVARQIADSLALAIQNDYFLKEIRSHENKLRHMSINILEAQEMERKRLSAELHDEFGQTLTGIAINFSIIRKKLGQAAFADIHSGIHSRMDEIEQAINLLSDQVHDLSLDLRPPMLEDLGMVPTIRWFLKKFQEINRLSIQLLVENEIKNAIPDPVAVTMYRVLQEAMNNIAKHAHATRVRVRLDVFQDKVILTITDDGVGFDITAVRLSNIKTRGLGLIGMRERLDLLHGKLRIHSGHNQGTTIQAIAPITEDIINGQDQSSVGGRSHDSSQRASQST